MVDKGTHLGRSDLLLLTAEASLSDLGIGIGA